jgi:hypothetical protein
MTLPPTATPATAIEAARAFGFAAKNRVPPTFNFHFRALSNPFMRAADRGGTGGEVPHFCG